MNDKLPSTPPLLLDREAIVGNEKFVRAVVPMKFHHFYDALVATALANCARSERGRISDERIKQLVSNAVYGGMKCDDVSLSECIEHAIRVALEESFA